jgi:hypothetical protein
MALQIIGDDGRILSGPDAQAHVIISGYDNGQMDANSFIGAAMPLMNRSFSLSPSVMQNLTARFQQAQNVTGTARVASASPGPIREVVQGIDSTTLILPGGVQVITINASMVFRPTRLMIGPTLAPLFTIQDIRVAADSLFLSAGNVPGESFLPQSVNASALKRRTAQPGTPVSITVENIDGASHRFRAALFGEASDVSSC